MLARYLYLVNFAEDRIGKDDLRMYTPENERLEAKKSPVVKGRSSSKPPLRIVFHVNFQGCIQF